MSVVGNPVEDIGDELPDENDDRTSAPLSLKRSPAAKARDEISFQSSPTASVVDSGVDSVSDSYVPPEVDNSEENSTNEPDDETEQTEFGLGPVKSPTSSVVRLTKRVDAVEKMQLQYNALLEHVNAQFADIRKTMQQPRCDGPDNMGELVKSLNETISVMSKRMSEMDKELKEKDELVKELQRSVLELSRRSGPSPEPSAQPASPMPASSSFASPSKSAYSLDDFNNGLFPADADPMLLDDHAFEVVMQCPKSQFIRLPPMQQYFATKSFKGRCQKK